MSLEIMRELRTPSDTGIVLLVLDGLGGLAVEAGGPTELEAAETPNMDRLAREGVLGLHEVVAPGITPGSGPGHLGLFGYDPIRFRIGRGVLEALGVDFDLASGDLAARGNFCTVDDSGVVTDRRAGRIPTEEARSLCAILREIELPGVQLFVESVKEHRFLLVLRGEGLAQGLTDTDPGVEGRPPDELEAEEESAEVAAQLVRRFIDEAGERLADRSPANMILLRGFAMRPEWPRFPEVFGLRSVAIAQYPMYRGVAKLVGMNVASDAGDGLDELLGTLERSWPEHDFAFVHVKETDKAGEDGDFQRKVRAIEEVDRRLDRVLALEPDVVLITGDHSTPAALRSHSWHPVPVLVWSRWARSDDSERFGERWCRSGGLGLRRAQDLMPLALAHARRLGKYGA